MEDDGKPLPFGRKRVVPLTAAEEQEALALRLPESLPFKLHQAAGRIHRPGQREKRLKHFIAQEEYHTLPASEPTFVSIEAPPSTYPLRRFCDVTGQPARYTDPRTKLRFADAAAFAQLRTFSAEAVQARLALRRAATVLK